MRRRDLLKLSALSLAAPTLFIPRISRAATPAFGAARHLLILYAEGGLRSHSTFNAVGSLAHNPFGTQAAAPGTEWTLGAACGSADLQSSRGSIPAFAKITQDVAVIPCVDHAPGGAPVVDHLEGRLRIGTGAAEGQVGLLSLIGRHLPALSGGWPTDRAPPVEIGRSAFGLGSGDYQRVRPLGVTDARSPLLASGAIASSAGLSARQVLDASFSQGVSAAYRGRVDAFLSAKDQASKFASLLSDPLLALAAAPEATAGGYENRELLEIFGDEPSGRTDPRWGLETAMALRFLQLGSPAVVITKGNFDFHDRERQLYGPVTTDLVRQLAGLRYVLGALDHPAGGRYWDHTVVAVLSEFSRNNGDPRTGFNSGDGSDHVLNQPEALRNQAIALMGGPITARGRLLGATDASMKPLGPVYSSRSLLATFLDLLGVDPSPFWGDPPIRELFP